MNKIDVPTYIGGAFQDEQTGGEWSSMLQDFAPGTPLKVFMTNGTHVESLAGQDFTHLLEFIDLYVGKRIPSVNPILLAAAPGRAPGHLRGIGHPVAAERVRRLPDLRGGAGRLPEPRPRSGWCGRTGPAPPPGEPVGTAQSQFTGWPVPGTIAAPMYLQPDGQLAGRAELGARRPAPGLVELRVRPHVQARLGLRRLDQRHLDGRDPDQLRTSTGTRSPRVTRSASSPSRTPPRRPTPARAASTCGCARPPSTPTSRPR